MTCHVAAAAFTVMMLRGMQATSCTTLQEMSADCNSKVVYASMSAGRRTCAQVASEAAASLAPYLKMQGRDAELVCFCACSRVPQGQKLVGAMHPSFVAHNGVGWLWML